MLPAGWEFPSGARRWAGDSLGIPPLVSVGSGVALLTEDVETVDLGSMYNALDTLNKSTVCSAAFLEPVLQQADFNYSLLATVITSLLAGLGSIPQSFKVKMNPYVYKFYNLCS